MIKPWKINEVLQQQDGSAWVNYTIKKIIHAECCKKTIHEMTTVIVVPPDSDIDEYLHNALRTEGWVE